MKKIKLYSLYQVRAPEILKKTPKLIDTSLHVSPAALWKKVVFLLFYTSLTSKCLRLVGG